MAASSSGLFSGSLPEIYERYLVAPLFRPFAQALLDRVGIGQNVRLLDVACGTGIVARLARDIAGDRARIVGVDASPGMLAMARSVAPTIDWREGDAGHLPTGDGETFDVVTCHQGMQFFSDKPSAAREMRRVLAAGGRLGFATWLAIEDIPLMRDLQRVAERHLGPYVDARHSFGDPNRIRPLLTSAGFTNIQLETVTRTIRFDGGAEIFPRLNAMAIVGMNAAVKAMNEEQQAQISKTIAAESADAVRAYVQGNELVVDMASTIGVAHV